MNGIILDPDSTGVHSQELLTWAGHSKFCYSGSVEAGITLYFGKSQKRRIRAGLFAEMLEHFAGRNVKVGTSLSQPPRDSLGAWLMENFTKTAMASYVAPILIAERLAFKSEEDSTSIKFIDGIRLEPDLNSILSEYFKPAVSLYDQTTANYSTFEWIDGKTLACLDYEGKVRYKRVPCLR